MGFSGQPNLSQSIFGTGLGERCRNTRKEISYILYTRSGVPNGRQTTNRFFFPSYSLGSTSGTEIVTPFYWSLAPITIC